MATFCSQLRQIVAGCRLQTAGCKLQTADSGLAVGSTPRVAGQHSRSADTLGQNGTKRHKTAKQVAHSLFEASAAELRVALLALSALSAVSWSLRKLQAPSGWLTTAQRANFGRSFRLLESLLRPLGGCNWLELAGHLLRLASFVAAQRNEREAQPKLATLNLQPATRDFKNPANSPNN